MYLISVVNNYVYVCVWNVIDLLNKILLIIISSFILLYNRFQYSRDAEIILTSFMV